MTDERATSPPAFGFERLTVDPATGARRGRLTTARGVVETPAFMPVATLASVKGVDPGVLRTIGAQIVLANAYHLYLRPGPELVRELGGVSSFMGWNGPVLTDSGGYQAFSLADRSEIHDDGVRFRSHLDGSAHDLTPAKVVGVQEALGVDVLMPLDDCAPYPADRARLEASLERTDRWLERSVGAWRREGALFGIVQGGMDLGLRRQSVEQVLRHDLPGNAVGGLSVGEPRDLFYETAAATAPLLPADRPRYVMGTGTPTDLIELVGMGYDMFDCVMPTRNARNGTVFTSTGKLNLKNARFARDPAPIDEECTCPTCLRFTRAYLRHLFVAKEMLGPIAASVHNLAHYFTLMREMREALEAGSFPEYRNRSLARRTSSEQP